MTCDHTKWVTEPPYEDDWTGEIVYPERRQVGTTEDTDTGRFRCTRCGEIFYYTGLWRKHWESGRKLLNERTGHIKENT